MQQQAMKHHEMQKDISRYFNGLLITIGSVPEDDGAAGESLLVNAGEGAVGRYTIWSHHLELIPRIDMQDSSRASWELLARRPKLIASFACKICIRKRLITRATPRQQNTLNYSTDAIIPSRSCSACSLF